MLAGQFGTKAVTIIGMTKISAIINGTNVPWPPTASAIFRLPPSGIYRHLRNAFRAQVPDWVPLKKDDTVVYSGIAEIALGSALVLTDEEHQELVGKIAAAFFVAVFPGNVSQYVNRRDAFGLDTDGRRLARLFFQPVFVYWALKSTQRGGGKRV